MEIRLFQIDAFTDKVFHGNPAAVCPLDSWLPESLMQQIAMENNQAETAFYVKGTDCYKIRWFTPSIEVDLCGHATLAAAFVIFHFEHFPGRTVEFDSRSGRLSVTRDGDLLTLNFPADNPVKADAPPGLIAGMGLNPHEVYRGKSDFMFVYSTPADIQQLKPNMELIAEADARGVIATAPGQDVDFVSRFFAPQSGIAEDPVTGSAHTTLTPYWAARLGRGELTARQLSRRQGWLHCRMVGDRVEISGHARSYMSGIIDLDLSDCL